MEDKKSFTDLQFRGTRWYLAEEVDQELEALEKRMDQIMVLLDDIKKKILEGEG